jgi:hypothetical protein
MITGVSLKGSETALVLLQQQQKEYHPIALAITGQYDRLGSIDMIDENDNTDFVLRYFLAQLETKAFVVDEESMRISEAFPIETVEQLLRGFERNINDDFLYASLNGEPVVFALIAGAVWQGVARAAKLKPAALEKFRKAFLKGAGPNAIYGEQIDDVNQELHDLAAVSELLTARGLIWKPASDVSQHYSDDMREYLAEARTAFQDSEVVMKALKAYENDVGHLLKD